MTFRFSWALALCVLFVTQASAIAQQRLTESQTAGMVSVHYKDSHRRNWSDTGPRPLNATVWYPAGAGATETPWEAGIFKAGLSARDAPMSASPGKMPLVLLSHGTGGAAAGLAWLGEALARKGYIVAAVSHHGNTGAEVAPMLQGTVVWWDRPQDVSVLIDRLLADPSFGSRIDATRIGVAGFSIGGYTALATVGARLSRNQWQKFCADRPGACKLPPEVSDKFSDRDVERLMTQDPRMLKALSHMDDSFADPRIKAAFVMAPVVAAAMTSDSLKAIKVSVHIVAGTRDDQAVPEYNAKPIAALIPGAELQIVPDGTHYMFLPGCNARGNNYVKELCLDPPGLDREAVHRRVIDAALVFFSRTLAR
jgi:predicted dienelactone hydrolase